MGLREQIFSRVDRPPTKVAVPEWGMDVYVRPLSLGEKLAFEAQAGAFDDLGEMDAAKRVMWFAKFVALVVCDEAKVRAFSESDEEALAHEPATALERLVLAGMRLNIVRAEDVDALGKDSAPTLNGSLPSASPDISG